MKLRTAASLTAVLASLLVASAAQAQKFAYVDMQRALGEIAEGKAAKAKLKAQFDAKQKELDQKQEELKRDNANLESMAREGVLKDDKLREKKAELEKKLMEVTKYWQDSQKALSEEERRLTQEIFAKMAGIIREMAETEKFSMVFDKTESGLLYAPDELDLTNELIRKYNAKFGGGVAGAPKSDVPKAAPKKP